MQKIKRIIALIIVILWVALIIATLVCAIIPNETAHTLFVGLLYTDIGLPVVAYAMILITKILNRKNTGRPVRYFSLFSAVAVV